MASEMRNGSAAGAGKTAARGVPASAFPTTLTRDRPTDVQLAKNLGARAIYITNSNFPLNGETDDTVTAVVTWDDIYELLCRPRRKASHRRTTNETDILVEIDLDDAAPGVVPGIDIENSRHYTPAENLARRRKAGMWAGRLQTLA